MSLQLALVFVMFALAGVVQVVLAHWWSRGTRELVARGKRAPGRWIGKATQGTIDGQASSHDVVEFTDADGQRREVASRVGVPWSTYKDRPVTVLYDPADPERVVIDRWIELWGGPAIFYANGGLMVLVAAVGAALVFAGVLKLE